MECDCKQGNEITEGIPSNLCDDCRNEWELSDGTYCLAYRERAVSRYGPNFTPAQSSHVRQSFNRVRRKIWRPGGGAA